MRVTFSRISEEMQFSDSSSDDIGSRGSRALKFDGFWILFKSLVLDLLCVTNNWLSSRKRIWDLAIMNKRLETARLESWFELCRWIWSWTKIAYVEETLDACFRPSPAFSLTCLMYFLSHLALRELSIYSHKIGKLW